jgi:nucleoside-diphosphate-sugar epimerase
MGQNATLVTGSNGEIGQSLIRALHRLAPARPIIALDVAPAAASIRDKVAFAIDGDINDRASYEPIAREFRVDRIYHLAALLSTRAEHDPALAHHVNVEGTFNIYNLAVELSNFHGAPTRVMFPSSIAVYGLTNKLSTSREPVQPDEYLHPITMYGLNKLYCEELGTYYARHYGQMWEIPPARIDFRCLRFPGIISADTLPSGGTSDYGPEMLHAAAQGKPYAAFVRPDTTIPFMAMPDAVTALLMLADAPPERLTRTVYDVTAFSISAGEIADMVRSYFPDAAITFVPNSGRQRIVDSWPAAVDDSPARRDWGWAASYDAAAAFADYLIPAVCKRYGVRLTAHEG